MVQKNQKKHRESVVPEQNRKICGTICLCQLTVVASFVSLVYLNVAIYVPGYKLLQANFETEPVMCQTINATIANQCTWASCGEWCLSKSTGFCPQIHATVRRNGTDVIFENCNRLQNMSCPQVNLASLKRYNCNNGSECDGLTGIFNCSLGHCKNMSKVMLCYGNPDGETFDAEKDNSKLNGFFRCRNAQCTRITKAFSCDRYCPSILTDHINIFLMHDDNIITANCSSAYALNKSNGSRLGTKLKTPYKFWNEKQGAIVTSCFFVDRLSDKIR